LYPPKYAEISNVLKNELVPKAEVLEQPRIVFTNKAKKEGESGISLLNPLRLLRLGGQNLFDPVIYRVF
jgi:hypothetical protein